MPNSKQGLTDMINNLGIAEDDAQINFFDKIDNYKKSGVSESDAIQKTFDDNPNNAFGDVSTLKDFYDMHKGVYDEPELTGQYSPVSSFTQRVDILSKENKLEYPKYRTLSEEQTRSYEKAINLPDVQRKSMQLDIEKAGENTFAKNAKNALVVRIANLWSDNVEMPLGNLMVSVDSAGHEVIEQALSKSNKVLSEQNGFAPQKPTYDENSVETLKLQGYTDKQIKEIEKPTVVATSGLKLVQSAMDKVQYNVATLPTVDEDSVAAMGVDAVFSAGEYLAAGLGGAKLAQTALKATAKSTATKLGKKVAEKTAQKGVGYEGVVDRYIGSMANKAGSAVATTKMTFDTMEQGATSSVQKYIEDTGDVELKNYKGDLKKVAIDAASTHLQNVIEKMGFNKFIRDPRAVKKWGEWSNGFVQEFTQGEVSDVAEFVKGNQTAMDILNNIPKNAMSGVFGSITQGSLGTAVYQHYHNKNVNDLVDVIMAQKPNKTEQEVRQFAENKVKAIESEMSVDMVKEIVDFTDATQYQGKIYENIRDNVKKAIDYQMDIMKDTDEGSEFENLTEDELAQYVEQVAHDETDKVVIESLENGTPLSESPRLKGITIAGTYYLEGEDYAQETKRQAEATRQALLEAVYAEREAKKAEKLAEQMARGAEKAQLQREKKETAQQTKEAKERERLEEKSAKEVAKSVAQSLKQQKQETKLAEQMAEGAEKAQEKRVAKETAQQTREAKQRAKMGLDFQDVEQQFDLADENESLDAIYPEYTGETIEVDGKERTVYNSNGNRIAKSKEALTNFWRWFGDSKVVDEQGRPLVVYHGTDAEFDTFDKNIKSKRNNLLGKGFYFTNQEEKAKWFGNTIMPVYLKIENPETNAKLFPDTEQLKQSGKDGIIKDQTDILETEPITYVVFEPNQIKSVENRGTYSSDTGNIYFQTTEDVRPETARINYLESNLAEWQEFLDTTIANNTNNWNAEILEDNRKRAKKAISNIKKEIKELQESLKEPIEEKLYATHNMSLAGVKGALKLGGLAMPSLAIRKVSQGNINQFGDIVFVGGTKLVEPSKTTEVYDRDAWTPSLAYNMRYELNDKGKKFITDVATKHKSDHSPSVFLYNIENDIDSPKSNTMAMQLYCLDRGIDYDSVSHYELSNSLDYLTWYEENITGNSDPYLWAENADNTDMKKYKYTLDNMMRILKRQERSGGGFIGDTVLTTQHLLQFMANKYKNLQEIKANKNKLVSREEQTNAISEIDEAFYQLADELKLDGKTYEHYENRTGLAIAAINNENEIKANLDRYNLDSSDESVGKVKQFTQKMKDVVTDYFEVKPRRIVDFNEFSGVIVPNGAEYDDVASKLENAGVFVQRVEKGNESEYQDALMEIQRRYKTVLFQTQKQSRKGGAYDPRTRSITLGSGANVTTFPHEFAHYWIEKNFKWARSGKASQEWMRQWSAVEKWLGIDPDDKYLDKAASEKFARAYERFLGEEQVPLVLKKSLGDFRDFVLDHYDFELDEAKGLTDKFGRPIKLNDDVKNWFKKSIYETYSDPVESEVVVERLRKDAEDNKEIKQADQENETIRENVKNSESFKTADAETNLMDVQKSAGISNEQIIGKREIGGGEQKESKGKIAEQLGGRTYESTSWEIQEQMVADYLKTVSLDQALEDLDNETYPEKIDPNFLRSALTEKLLDAGREMEATALIEETADDFSDAAQRLQAARTLNTPFTNAIQTLNIAKAEQLARAKFGNKKTAVADLDAAMNRLVAKYEKDFLNAQTDEEREMVYAALQDEAVRTIGSLNKDESSKLDFQTIEDKEERKQAREIRKQQKRRASIKAYRGKAKRALKQALGLEPTRQQVREIRKRAVKVQKAIADFRKDVRQNKTSAIDPIKVLEAQNELNNYMNSQLPTRYLGTLADAANSYMMANMLWNPATNVFNLESTWVQMIPHLTALAINNGTFGTISAREKGKIIKSAIITQIKTGYNIFSLRDFFDNKTIWAEKFYEAQSVLGKGIRAPLTALGLMDTMNKGIVFLQAVDSMATKQAREEGKKNNWTAEQVKQRAKELFYQALNTDPRTITIDGLKIRKAAVQEGEEATFTQNTRTAQIVNKVRKALNFGGKTGLGNVIMPFTTTIANIAEDTVANYSLGLVKNTPKAVKAIATQFDKTATAEMKKEAWKEVLPETKNAIKNVIGILILLSFALGGDDDDYVLGYDRQTAKDKDIRTNRNAPNGYAVRLGDKWVDLDLFGIGSQYAKMYMIARRGNFEPDAWTNAIVSGVDLLPGVSELQSMYDTFTDMSKMKGEWEGVSELASDKIEELSVRLIPASAFFGQIASIADTSKRETWNNWYDKMKAKIPGLRETLPERTSTQTGEVIPQTDTVFNLATGSRIKDYIEPTGADEVRYEFAETGKPLSYREGNSKLKELGKDTVAYKKAVNRVRKDFTKKLENISDNPEYQRLDIDQKRKVVNELHKEALTDVKVDLGLEKPKKASKKRLKKQGKNDNLK